MFERMMANELLENIYSGEIAENSKINIIFDDEVTNTIWYKNGRLVWENGGNIDTAYLCDIETEFEVVEDEIDIDKIQELDEDKEGKKLIGKIARENRQKINELIRAINQINRKMKEEE